MLIYRRGHQITVAKNGPMPRMRQTELCVTPTKRQAMIDHILSAGCSSRQEAEELLEQKLNEEAWTNGVYTCVVDRSGPLIHLSIRRVDRGHAKDWRHLQQIKNDILGEEAEAVELYPAESRLVDTANQFHLWCKPPGHRFEFGFNFRLVQHASDNAAGIRQR